MQSEYRVIFTRKSDGSARRVHALRPDVAQRYRAEVPALAALAATLDVHRVAHGFMPGRSPVTNALAHVGPHEASLCVDIKDFFDSLHYDAVFCAAPPGQYMHGERLTRKVREHIILSEYPLCASLLHNRPAAQGFPTSPAVANVLMYAFDAKLHAEAASNGCVYTRYADDIAISGSVSALARMYEYVQSVVTAHYLRLAEHKTRWYHSRRGARIITGVGVYADRIAVPRRIKRKLRAALHQRKTRVAAGLAEWSRLKAPQIQKWVLRSIEAGMDPGSIAQVAQLSSLSR